MATGRHDVDFEGTSPRVLSFKIDDSTITYEASVEYGTSKVGLAVELVSARTVALARDGKGIAGKLLSVTKDGFCSVQVGGGMNLPAGNGASLTVGKKIVGALNASSARGYIREVATGTAAELGVARGYIIDATDTAAVQIDF